MHCPAPRARFFLSGRPTAVPSDSSPTASSKPSTLDVDSAQIVVTHRSVAEAPGDWVEWILFSPAPSAPLMRVSASGGSPVAITKVDTAQYTSHRWPFSFPMASISSISRFTTILPRRRTTRSTTHRLTVGRIVRCSALNLMRFTPTVFFCSGVATNYSRHLSTLPLER